MARDDCSQGQGDDLFVDGHDDSRSGGTSRVGRYLHSRGTANFIGGAMVGISVVIPALLIDLAENYGALVILGSLILGFAGIAMFAFGANANADRHPNSPPE